MSEWRLQFRGTLFPLRSGEVTLGRSGYASIVVNNPLTSREHALVRPAGSALELVDLGSKNGTFVNGNRISGKVALQGGDQIKIGTDVIEVLRTSAEDPTQLRAPTQPGRVVGPGARVDEGETDTTVHQKRSIDLAERLFEATRSTSEHPTIARSIAEILNDFLGETQVQHLDAGERQRILGLVSALGEWRLGPEMDAWRHGIASRLGARL